MSIKISVFTFFILILEFYELNERLIFSQVYNVFDYFHEYNVIYTKFACNFYETSYFEKKCVCSSKKEINLILKPWKSNSLRFDVFVYFRVFIYLLSK